MLAAGKGHLAEVQRLVERGADVNMEASDGTTPLFMAAEHDHLSVAQYLVQRGADKDKATNDSLCGSYIR
jgi:ankyrin repeat protein